MECGFGSGEFDPSVAKLNATGRDTLRNLGGSAPWMLKDPQLCLTLPAWNQYFEHAPHTLFTRRYPLSAALSTCHRSQTEVFHGLRSWLFHNRNAIRNVKGRRVVRASHKAMMEDPLEETLRIAVELTHRCDIFEPFSTWESEKDTRSQTSASYRTLCITIKTSPKMVSTRPPL